MPAGPRRMPKRQQGPVMSSSTPVLPPGTADALLLAQTPVLDALLMGQLMTASIDFLACQIAARGKPDDVAIGEAIRACCSKLDIALDAALEPLAAGGSDGHP